MFCYTSSQLRAVIMRPEVENSSPMCTLMVVWCPSASLFEQHSTTKSIHVAVWSQKKACTIYEGVLDYIKQQIQADAVLLSIYCSKKTTEHTCRASRSIVVTATKPSVTEVKLPQRTTVCGDSDERTYLLQHARKCLVTSSYTR